MVCQLFFIDKNDKVFVALGFRFLLRSEPDKVPDDKDDKPA